MWIGSGAPDLVVTEENDLHRQLHTRHGARPCGVVGGRAALGHGKCDVRQDDDVGVKGDIPVAGENALDHRCTPQHRQESLPLGVEDIVPADDPVRSQLVRGALADGTEPRLCLTLGQLLGDRPSIGRHPFDLHATPSSVAATVGEIGAARSGEDSPQPWEATDCSSPTVTCSVEDTVSVAVPVWSPDHEISHTYDAVSV